MPERIVIACGGTGGHLFPGIAVAEICQKRGHEVLLLISEKKIDSMAVEGYEHLTFERVQSVPMPRLLSLAMVPFIFRSLMGLLSCRKVLKNFDATVVMGMGGFTSTIPLMAGRMRRCKTLVHESNAIPGRANRLNAKFSDQVLVGLEACAEHFDATKTRVVGTPLRTELNGRPDKTKALQHFDLKPDKKTVLVMGGSQGARGINQMISESLDTYFKADVQILHIAGIDDFGMVQKAFDEFGESGKVLEFCAKMGLAYEVADVAVCRSGASSLAELACFALPAVLIPYPYAAEDHQTKNAEIYERSGAALLYQQKEMDAAQLASVLLDLMSDDERLAKMGESMNSFAIVDAADQVCDAVEALANT
jgi:UDP-N-acetylglucosamine--N-acetylmuramyl-(pentapeptide) pyrophosphoryl-undecaprenol N-acetylglucosamine transferase